MLLKNLAGNTLWVMSRKVSAQSTAIAATTSGLCETMFHAPIPPEEKPKTPRLLAFAIVGWCQPIVRTPNASCGRV